MSDRTPAEKYFDEFSTHRIESSRKFAQNVIIAVYAVLILVIGVLFLTFQSRGMRAVSLVEICPESSSGTGGEIGDETMKLFVKRFAALYSEQSPEIARNLAEAYNLMTPRYQQILLAKRVDAGKVDRWYDKNVKSDIVVNKMKVGDEQRKVGTVIPVKGTATMTFRPMVGWNGNEETFKESKVRAFFQMSLMVVPVTEKTPWGLLVDHYTIDYFADDELLKAYLLERKIDME